MELSFKQVGDGLLLTADGIHITLLDVDKEEFLAADVIEFILVNQSLHLIWPVISLQQASVRIAKFTKLVWLGEI